jgi:DNA polymerase-1
MSKLIVIDLSNYIYRAFYAITPLNAPDGTPVNAVYGVLGMVHNLITKYKPTHVVVARDSSSADSIRKAIYPEYKSNRSSMPDNLSPQFPLVNEMIEALGMTQVRISGYEADDVIGCVATQWKDKFDEILIATGDKDILQFVADNVKVVDTLKNITYGREEVRHKMGCYPEHIVDYLSLVGDTSDNIPGVSGIGPKGAVALIEQLGTVENMIANIGSITTRRIAECLRKGTQDALISKDLATIRTTLDLGKQPEDCSFQLLSSATLEAFFDRLGFQSWKGRL